MKSPALFSQLHVYFCITKKFEIGASLGVRKNSVFKSTGLIQIGLLNYIKDVCIHSVYIM